MKGESKNAEDSHFGDEAFKKRKYYFV